MFPSGAPRRWCPVCNAPHATCGPGDYQGAPLTLSNLPMAKAYTMDDLREYYVVLSGSETTAMLSAADAARLGGRPVTPDTEPAADPTPPKTAARTVPNAARVAPNKRRV